MHDGGCGWWGISCFEYLDYLLVWWQDGFKTGEWGLFGDHFIIRKNDEVKMKYTNDIILLLLFLYNKKWYYNHKDIVNFRGIIKKL